MVITCVSAAAQPTRLQCSDLPLVTQRVGVPFRVPVKAAAATQEVWVYDNQEELVGQHRAMISGTPQSGQWVTVTLNTPGRRHRLTFVAAAVDERIEHCETIPFDVEGDNSKEINNRGLVVTGLVVEARENPISRAVIELLSGDSDSITQTTTTDDKGSYTIRVKEPGEYVINVIAKGWEPRQERVVAVVGQSLDLKKSPAQQQHTTRMRVRDRATCSTTKTPVLILPGIMESTESSTTVMNVYPRLKRVPTTRWDSSDLTIMQKEVLGWNTMLNLLTSHGYTSGCDLFVLPYDWSLDLMTVRDMILVPWIKEAKRVAQSAKVDIVAHSMGGIIARAYVQSQEYAGDVRKLGLVGTPSMGSILTYPLWEGSDPIGSDFVAHSDESFIAGYLYTNTINYLYRDRHGSDICSFPSLVHRFTPSSCDTERMHQFLHTELQSLGQLLPMYHQALLINGTEDTPIVVMENMLLKALNNVTCFSKTGCVDLSGMPYTFNPPQSVLIKHVNAKLFVSDMWTTPNSLSVIVNNTKITQYPDGRPTDTTFKKYGAAKGDQTVTVESVLFGSDHWDVSLPVQYLQHSQTDHDVGSHAFLMCDFRHELFKFLNQL